MKWILFLLCVCVASIAVAADVYVDAANEGGTEDGTTEGTAWGTIAEGLSDAADGETIYIKGGTAYTGETLQTGDKTLTLVGYTTTTTDNGQAEIDATSVTYGLEINTTTSRKWITLKNLVIHSATSHGVYVNNTVDTFVQTSNCIVRDNGGAGLYADRNPNHYVVAVNSVFANNTARGINCGGGLAAYACLASGNGTDGFYSAVDALFVKCVAVDNANEGFEAGQAGNWTISAAYCVADKNGGDGFYFYTRASPYLASCVAMRNGDYGIQIASTAIAAIVGCVFGADSFANTTGQTSGSIDYGSTTVSTDPFTAIWTTTTNEAWEGLDYRVTSGSALFDVLRPIGEYNNVMQSYESVGPKVQNPDGAVYVSDPGDLNPTALDEDTASQVAYVLLVDSSDNTTPETGISGPTITISKAGGAFAAPSDGTWTEIGNGLYSIGLNATDTDTAGILITKVVATGCADDYELLQVGSSIAPSAAAIRAEIDANSTQLAAILADTGTDGVVLANDAITAAKIAADAIGSSEIATDAIGAAEVAAGALVAGTEITGLADSTTIGTDVWASTTRTLTAATLTSGTLANSGDAATYKADVSGLSTFDPALDTVANVTAVGSTAAVGDKTGYSLATGAITAGVVATGAIDADAIAADAITSAKIADDAIAAEHLADNAITDASVADDVQVDVLTIETVDATTALDAAAVSLDVATMMGTDISSYTTANTWGRALNSAAQASAGLGDTAVDHTSDATLGYTTSGSYGSGTGIGDAIIRAYLKTDYDAGTFTERGASVTDDDGGWEYPIYLDSGLTYTFVFRHPRYQTAVVEYTVP